MSLKFYDTLQGKIVDFQPRNEGEISIYACGPTVYDVPHLGHARTAITYDVIARYLKWCGNKVTLVSNVTDIDDKIIKRAQEENRTEPEVAEEFLEIYNQEIIANLGVLSPDIQPRATEYVSDPTKSKQGMVSLIQELIDKGAAYKIEGSGVYFDVSKYSDYGRLVHRTPQDLEESGQGRIDPNEQKNNPLDFALWKAAKPGEPEWESSWGMPGRPGWHIECVAMALGELGDGFDIHGGGSDLIFPHHENERAEACAMGKEFAKYWIHSGLVNIGGKKMAKSENNYIKLSAQLEDSDPDVLRLAMLQSHYRSDMELTSEILQSSYEAIRRTRSFADEIVTYNEIEIKSENIREEDKKAFREYMDNDFATPSAIAFIFELVNEAMAAHDNLANDKNARTTISQCMSGVREFSTALGLHMIIDYVKDLEIEKLKKQHGEARADKNYELSDQLRDELEKRGVMVKDSPDKTSSMYLYFRLRS